MPFWFILVCTMTSVFASPAHPRLLLTPAKEKNLLARLENDPLCADIHRVVIQRAEEILTERTCRHQLPDGRRLLAESRRALRHVLYCGMAWRTTGERRFRDRVVSELEAATAMKDWNPAHFLDTAEMAAAVALGYDWTFETLPEEQKKKYENALIEKALSAVPLSYGKSPWWFREARSNWSQVCAAGLSLAAEMVREREPALAKRILGETSRLLSDCTALYLPHGGYAEGPGYWHYGTNYHLIGLAAAATSGREPDLPPIFERTGDFILQLRGPTGLNFNFADGRASRRLPSPAQSWIAGRFRQSNQSAVVRRQLTTGLATFKENPESSVRPGSYFPLHLIWLPAPTEKEPVPPRSDQFDGKQAIAIARTGWQSDAAWLALKGGTGAVSHGHLDVGSFVYEAGGVRWFHDMGPDDYNLPGYFHGDRWQYFRLQNHSHNTLVIDDALQATPSRGCPLTPWSRKDGALSLSADLSPAYPDQAAKLIRSATFDLSSGAVTLRDEIDAPAGPVRWAVVTQAEITIDKDLVVLSEGGKKLLLKRTAEAGPWQEFSLTPPNPNEEQNEKFKMIGFLAQPKPTLSLTVSWQLKESL